MKKSRLLALTLVVAIALMGAGYAYWTQSLTIENTVTTGKLDVKFQGPVFTVDDWMDKTSSFSGGDYVLTGVFKKAYPDADISIGFDLVNNGTMKAHVRSFDVTGAKSELVLVKSYKLNNGELQTVTEGTTLKAFLDQSFDTQSGGKGIVLGVNGVNGDPVDTCKVLLNLEINPDANSDSLSLLYLAEDNNNAEITFNITAKAYQYNDDTDKK